ncbi:class I SAM-dependent methyltransferase [Paenibacillus tarimensis]|uniref:class I SAM-dependent methyltransferase n=1 Tax=Paenibacillus tarimensis TaxID=416012 RepID=UPI001F1F9713|nr:class I SAM-dependent methyltransferase [Paenibacillus tarimensis]MCF2944115.1 class I SAM-dependent methyltransferase [Paenibacillus tarimensis]
MFEQVILNKYGYYELRNKPSKAELNEYYTKKYYQDPRGSYEATYSSEEISFFNNHLDRKYNVLNRLIDGLSSHTYKFLDVGCGEGWALQYFKDKAWQVTGMDFSRYGCERFNPGCAADVITGDIEESIKLKINRETFDCILLDNVLEHLLDPLETLNDCSKLLSSDGILIVEVPNDFSLLQKKLFSEQYVSRNYWVVSPDHISYFNKTGLKSLCEEVGLNEEFFMGDFPIDFNLLNPNTNYIDDSTKGKSCHNERVVIENFLNDISVEQTINLYAALGDMGLGRSLIGFFRKKH